MRLRRALVPLALGTLLGLASCTLLDAATGADPQEASVARSEIKSAATAAGTILGGPLGGLLGDHLAEALIAGYLIYRRTGEQKRYSKAVKKNVLPSVVTPPAAT